MNKLAKNIYTGFCINVFSYKRKIMKKRIYTLLSFILIISLLASLSACTANEIPAEKETFAMSTFITQKVYGKNKEDAVNKVDALLHRLENKLSLFKEDSDIDKINQNAGISPVEVDEYTFDLIKTAKEYSGLSEGRFDITIAPLTLLWGIDTDHARVPSTEEIEQVLPLIDYRNIKLNEENKTVFLTEKSMKIDLGGVAKGYISNLIHKEYENLGITSAIVSIGGNIDIIGVKPDGHEYTLGIRDPLDLSGLKTIGKISVKDKVVATSGGYERFFEEDGKRYHHILDPKTGYPVESDLLSVTVISSNGGVADFLSTTLFSAGSTYINNYINDDRFGVIIVDQNKKIYLSDHLSEQFECTAPEYIITQIGVSNESK